MCPQPADLTDPSSFDFWEAVTTRFSDQDPLQHINNVAITAFLESGRAALLADLWDRTGKTSVSIVLANLVVDYRSEITYPGTVQVGGRLLAVGTRSITTGYGIFQGEKCCVTSRSVNVFFDRHTRRSAPPSAELADSLRARLVRESS